MIHAIAPPTKTTNPQRVTVIAKITRSQPQRAKGASIAQRAIFSARTRRHRPIGGGKRITESYDSRDSDKRQNADAATRYQRRQTHVPSRRQNVI